MFKSPWTRLIVFYIVKISAIMLIRSWFQKAAIEMLKSNPDLKYMFPEQNK